MHTNKFLKRAQAGLTLLEVMISLTIISASMLGLNSIADRYSADTKLTLAASQERTFGDAAKAYIKDNYAAVQTSAAVSTGTALIDVSTLITAGKLPTGFLTTNAYGQSLCALVIQPTANRLQAMVVSENGQAIDDLSLGSLAAIVGGSGGGVYVSDPTIIRGAIGGWSITTATFHNRVNNVNRHCDGTAGNVQLVAGHPVMALWFENGDTSSAFLARDAVPNRADLNTMNTPILMGAGTVQTSGGACANGVADLGKLARDVGGKVLMCDGTNWKTQGSAFWQDPIATYALLNSSTPCVAASFGQTRIVTTPSVGTNPRAYTCDSATSTWTALAINDSGNLVVGNTAIGTAGSTTASGALAVGTVEIKKQVTEGTSCAASPNGTVASDSTGLILSCQSGAWKRLFSLGTSSRDYLSSELSRTYSASGSSYTQTWTLSVTKTSKTFIYLQFKPSMSMNSTTQTINSLVFVNGTMCSFKSSQLSGYTGVHDVVCSFVANANTTYTIQMQFNNNPSSVSYWYDSGSPMLTYIEI